jgi:hypothetical protein
MSKEENKANENLVGSDDQTKAAPTTVEATPNGTIGTAETAPKLMPTGEAKSKKKKQLVALYSPNNRFWDDHGRLEKGYNFVEKADADAWLTQEDIRLATPEEVKANMPSEDDDQ